MLRLEMRVDFPSLIVVHVDQVETDYPCVTRLPQLRSMQNPEAFTASQVQDVRRRLLAEVVKRWRICTRKLAKQLVRLVVAARAIGARREKPSRTG